MSDSTALQQPAAETSLNDDLAEAFSGYDDEFNEITAEPQAEETEELEGGEETEETEEPTEELETPTEPSIQAPEHWSQADKETFSSAPPELQQWLLDRHKSMEGDYTRKSQEISEIKKTWEPVQELFAPHMEQLRANGQTPASVIQRWAQIDQAITQNPQQTIEWLANQYGVKLGQSDDDPYIDPQVQSLQQEIQQLKQSVVQREQMESQQRLSTVQNDLQQFAEEKTEAGELAHPYFEDVVEDMVRLAKAEQSAGRTPKIGDLYETAVWANPTIRERMLAAQREAAAKKAEQEARAKAAKAKKAQKTIKSSPDGDSVSELSLREQLTQAFN